MKRCLWVVPKGIFPVRDGARVANQAMLKAFRPHATELDIMIFNEDSKDQDSLDLYTQDFSPTHIYFLKRVAFTNLSKKLFFLGLSFLRAANLPVTTGYFHTKALKEKVQSILKERQYDLIVFDGLHPFTAFMDLPEFKNIPVVYRAHNVEGDLWSTAADKTNNSIIKKLLLWQGRKMASLEIELILRSKRVWNIAEEDMKRFKNLLNGADKNLSLIPVALDFKKSEIQKEVKNDSTIKLLFLGKMDWAPNRDGLKWFLEEIWPHVNHQKLELQIVGSGDSSWGNELFKQPGIKFFGFVKDLDTVYAQCDFSIIPIRYGSGTRIKVIESISKGMPIISTEMGVQGSGLEDYFHAETKEEWIKVLSGLDHAAGIKMSETAFIKLEEIYSPKTIGLKALKSLQD